MGDNDFIYHDQGSGNYLPTHMKPQAHVYIDRDGRSQLMNPQGNWLGDALKTVLETYNINMQGLYDRQSDYALVGEDMADRTRVIESEIERLQAELYEIRQYGTDDYDEGTVLLFDMVFPTHPDTVFDYAAIKADGSWWVTGKQGRAQHSWSSLVSFWKDRVQNIHKVEQTKVLFERNKPQAIEGDIVQETVDKANQVQDNPQA